MRQIACPIGREFSFVPPKEAVSERREFEQNSRGMQCGHPSSNGPPDRPGKGFMAPSFFKTVVNFEYLGRYIIMHRQQCHEQTRQIIDMDNRHTPARWQKGPSPLREAEHVEHFSVTRTIYAWRTDNSPI